MTSYLPVPHASLSAGVQVFARDSKAPITRGQAPHELPVTPCTVWALIKDGTGVVVKFPSGVSQVFRWDESKEAYVLRDRYSEMTLVVPTGPARGTK